MHIVLIRPGASLYSEQGRIAGNLELPLSTAGQAEVRAMLPQVEPLHLAAIYSHEAGVEFETAELLAEELGIKHKKLPELANLDHGLWQGMLIDEICEKQSKVSKTWQENAGAICPPEGEMLEEAQTRVEDALERIVRKHSDGAIGVVVQEPLASVIRHRLIGTEYGDLWEATATQPATETITIHPTRWRMSSSMVIPAAAPKAKNSDLHT